PSIQPVKNSGQLLANNLYSIIAEYKKNSVIFCFYTFYLHLIDYLRQILASCFASGGRFWV
ncbi:MAG: hypothetical protein ACTHYX_04150, partial [Psychrobacter sp.]